MVKAYLRYEPTGTFGVISSNANVIYDNCGRSLITSALESVLVWSVKQGNQVRALLRSPGLDSRERACIACVLSSCVCCSKPNPTYNPPNPHHPTSPNKKKTKSLTPAPAASSSATPAAAPEVTQLARSPTGNLLAAGYSDGSVRFWDLVTGDCTVTLQGHKGAVTALRFSKSGAVLASGANDTDVILWDVVGEAGVVRLRGHKGAITDVVRFGLGVEVGGWGWGLGFGVGVSAGGCLDSLGVVFA